MALEYNEMFENFSRGWTYYDIGYFINPKRTVGISEVSMLGELHNKAALIAIFDMYFNPDPLVAPESKDFAIEKLEQYIDIYKQRGYNVNIIPENFYSYLTYIMMDYFLQAYKSQNTKVDNYTVDLTKTTGYKPQFEYGIDTRNPSRTIRSLSMVDKLEYMKSILIQYGNIDSLGSANEKTIYTSKFNVNEYFYNYLLMDFNVFTLPKKVYDKKTETFIDYTKNPFLESDKETRLKEEISIIKKYVTTEDRHKYFR